MNPGDESILRLLERHKDLELTTGNIAQNLDMDRSYTSERLSVLLDKELVTVNRDANSYPFYQISIRGKKLLGDDINIEEIN